MLTQQYHRPQFTTDWTKTPAPPVTMISTLENGELVISTIDLAVGLGVKHKSLIETIRTYLASVERFGRVPFKTAPFETKGGVQQMTTAYLNENQALFVGSLSRNTVQVVAFKVTLVEEFDKARKAVADLFRKEPQTEGLVALVNDITGKMIRLENKLDRLTKSRQAYYKAFVVEKEKDRKAQRDTTKREEIFSLWERYVKLCVYETPYRIMEELHDKLASYYNLDLRKVKREAGEHYFDVAIKCGVGHCVVEALKSHMCYSRNLK